jgi:ribosomal protein S12 methylthiotransferase accessory factor
LKPVPGEPLLCIEALDPTSGLLSATLDAVRTESPALAALAKRWLSAFRLHSPYAEGLQFVGAQVGLAPDEASAFAAPVISVGGTGLDLLSATRAALGETCECLAQAWRPEDGPGIADEIWNTGWIAAIHGASRTGDCRAGLFRVSAYGKGSTRHVPIDCILRRPSAMRRFALTWPLSSGVAAGPTAGAAKLRATLELVERDALATWWLAPCPAPTPSFDDASAAVVARHLAALRHDSTLRSTWLLDITTGIGIPCIAALSTDADGFGLACGAAARLSPADAAVAAINELCQLELAAAFSMFRLAWLGPQALSSDDRRHLARSSTVTSQNSLLRPMRESASPRYVILSSLEEMLDHLHSCGIEVCFADLTRPDLDVPTFRAIAPELQPFSDQVAVSRFETARSAARDRGLCPPSFSIF